MIGNAQTAIDLPARDGRLSAIVSLAKSTAIISDARKRLEPGQAELIAPAIKAWTQALRPLRMVEPTLNGSEARKVKRAFLPNAAKMRPDMSEDKAEVWCGAICAALSDLPVRCLLPAMDSAMHRVFEFPTQLEAFIRERAQSQLTHERGCIDFLKQLHASLYGQQQALELHHDEAPLSDDEVRKLLNSPMGEPLINMGIRLGSIDAATVERLKAEA
jgi:hypothetical protein